MNSPYQVHDRELHARMSAALVALQSNVAWLVRRYNDGDLDQLDDVELAARRHLAMVRQLLPRAQSEGRRHRYTRPRTPLPVAQTEDPYRRAAQA